MNSSKRILVFALIALFCLSGAKCVVSGSSGGSSSRFKSDSNRDGDRRSGGVIVVSSGSGRLAASTVEGVQYKTASGSGFTTEKGEFEFDPEAPRLRFFIGDIALGKSVIAQERITILDLVSEGDINDRAVVNIARFLQSLDVTPGDNRITIPRKVHDKAVKTNPMVVAAIESLNFADEVAFINAASNLVAVLTADYPFTASLVDAPTAQARLRADLVALGM